MLLLNTPFFLACFCLLYLFSSAERQPPRPIISETFTSEVNVSFANIIGGYTVVGAGHISRDYSQLKQLINLQLTKFGHFQVYLQVKRHDLKKIFTVREVVREEIKQCHIDAFLEPFGDEWSWIHDAIFVGKIFEEGSKFEVWNNTVNSTVTNSLWVKPAHRNKPARYIIDVKHQHTIIVNFDVFKPKAPTNPNEYAVPNICQETPLPTAKHYINFIRNFDD